MTLPLRLVLISVSWAVIQIGSGYVAHILPVAWLATDNGLFRSRSFEREGRLYRRVFLVHRWKRYLPEGGAVFAGGMSKRHLALDSVEDRDTALRRFIAETRRAELSHWLPVLFSFTFFLWNESRIALWMPAIGFLGNLPFIIVQRTNRPRLQNLLKREQGQQ
ncbi:MAG: hypothetical protein ACOCU4_05665 [Alkalispirochaeta sp.]